MADLDIEEVIRSGYAHFNREHEPPPTWLPDGEFVNSREDPDHATYSGIEAIGPPVVGVHGNVDSADLRRLLPEERVVEAEGARIAMVHDAGPRTGRLERMRRRFGDRADLVVFGHSHTPLHEEAPDGFQILNPGSPTERRRAPSHTMGLIRVARGLAACDLIRF